MDAIYYMLVDVEKLIVSSQRGQITSAEYSTTLEGIRDSVDNAFYINGTLLISMASNTIAGQSLSRCIVCIK
jgi:hypothetical protein